MTLDHQHDGTDGLTRKVDPRRFATPGTFDVFSLVSDDIEGSSIEIYPPGHDVLKVDDEGRSLVVRIDESLLFEFLRRHPGLEIGWAVIGKGALNDEWATDGFTGHIVECEEDPEEGTRTYYCQRETSGGTR